MNAVAEPRVRALALYLPQYYPTSYNDAWWGRGFTEWTNVTRAKRYFPGHHQPALPGELGFYDLRVAETREQQALLAAEHGIEGFLYWHYWFGEGARLLEFPFDAVLTSGVPNYPFALAWANRTWTGHWHGADGRVLMEQRYPGPDDDRRHFELLERAFHDRRYITVDGRPLLYVLEPLNMPEPKRWIRSLREMARLSGFPDLFLVGEYSDLFGRKADEGVEAIFRAGYDMVARIRVPVRNARVRPISRAMFHLPVPQVYSFRDSLRPRPAIRNKPVSPVAIAGWDNTPRAGANGIVLVGSTPRRVENHIRHCVDALAPLEPERRLLFIKSWNEWAEGNSLEPSARYGRGYLRACYAALTEPIIDGKALDVERRWMRGAS